MADLPSLHRELVAMDPDRIASEQLVDFALDRVNASETYRQLHRESMIRDGLTFAAFERRQRELRVCKLMAAMARALGGPVTAGKVGEQSASKSLGKFGCKVVRKPVPEGRAIAERDADPRQSRAA